MIKKRITFTMIKPGAVAHEHIGSILNMINDKGFWIQAIKFVRLSRPEARTFYTMHRDKPFFDSLVEFMTSGPILAAVLEKENAVGDYRELIGATNPTRAEDGTIRKLFAESVQRNAVHGSDSDENAQIEASFFFSLSERFSRDGKCVMEY